MPIVKIISGGQTGVDRAALDAAINNHIPHGGWCPRGRIAEDGVIDGNYSLRETDSEDYAVRTRRNVRDTDGTLILNIGPLEGGTALTAVIAKSLKKPLYIINLDRSFSIINIESWLSEYHISILNVAGPRESKYPGIYQMTFDLLDSLFKKTQM